MWDQKGQEVAQLHVSWMMIMIMLNYILPYTV